MMTPLRCQLCGETYLGQEADRCPFCGAAGKQLTHAAEWVDYGKLDLDESDMEYCRTALGFEVSNTTFYRCCSNKAESIFTQAIFKRLTKHELEHAELLARMMGTEIPEFREESCPDTDREKFEEAHLREHRAIKYYLHAAGESHHPRVREVFRSLSEIEVQHLQISNVYK